MSRLYLNSLWKDILAVSQEHPEKIVLTDTKGRVRTYAQFVANVDAYARVLQQQGVQKGQRVLFLEKPVLHGLEMFFAVYRAGGVVVIADPAMGRDNFASRLEHAAVSHVLINPVLHAIAKVPGLPGLLRRLRPEIPDVSVTLPHCIVLPKKITPVERTNEDVSVPEQEDALIVFTSGTTGMPRGVVHSFRSLQATLRLIKNEIHSSTENVFLSSQLHFVIIALMSGAAAVIDTKTSFSAERYMKQLLQYRPTHTFLLPKEGEELLAHSAQGGRLFPDTVEKIMFGSAPVPVGFLKRFLQMVPEETEVFGVYGATEILPVSITTAQEKISFAGTGDYLGRLLPGVSVSFQEDEMLFTGPNLCKRYLHEHEPLQAFASGDLGFQENEGTLVLSGRKKDMIIKGHHNIYPALFESTIEQIAGVKKCALVGVFDDVLQDERIVLCVEPTSEQGYADAHFTQSIMQQLQSGPQSIDAYALPEHILLMELPLAGRSYKVDKAVLRTRAAQMV